MNCTEIVEQDLLERYLLDQLGETEQHACEQHYFECSKCFEQLQIARAIRDSETRAEATKSPVIPAGVLFPARKWIWGTLAIAVVLAGVLLSSRLYHRSDNQTLTQAAPKQGGPGANTSPIASPAVSPLIAELARIDPPPYNPVVLRGGEGQASRAFQEAMRHYSKGDYAAAVPGLREAVRLDPHAANANFYLGACYLLTDQADLAIALLERAVSADDPNFSEEAHFYLAKAHIRKNDIAAAKLELGKTVLLRGDREEEARKLEEQLTQLISPAR